MLDRVALQDRAQLGLGLGEPGGVVVRAGEEEPLGRLVRVLGDETAQDADGGPVLLRVEEQPRPVPALPGRAELVVRVAHSLFLSGARSAAEGGSHPVQPPRMI